MSTSIEYQRTMKNQEWGSMKINCDGEIINISCDIGRVTMSINDFERLTKTIEEYKKVASLITENSGE